MLKAVFFDLDGVLVDSYSITIAYFQDTLRHFGYHVPSVKDFESLLGLKTIDIAKRLLPQLSEEELKPVFEYSKEMSVKFTPQIPLAPGALPLLKELRKLYALVLITNRGKKTVDILLRKHNLNALFNIVVDRDMVLNHKPDPEGIIMALDKLGLTPSQAVYVGDMPEDIQAAHAANVRCVFLRSKYATATKKKPDYSIDDLHEIPALLRGLS